MQFYLRCSNVFFVWFFFSFFYHFILSNFVVLFSYGKGTTSDCPAAPPRFWFAPNRALLALTGDGSFGQVRVQYRHRREKEDCTCSSNSVLERYKLSDLLRMFQRKQWRHHDLRYYFPMELRLGKMSEKMSVVLRRPIDRSGLRPIILVCNKIQKRPFSLRMITSSMIYQMP